MTRQLVWIVSCWLCGLAAVAPAWAGSYEDFFAAIERDSAPALRDVLSRGVDPNLVDPQGRPAIFVALAAPAPNTLSVLLQDPQTQVDVRNVNDETPLMMACLKGMADVAQVLMERGADVNKAGWTPLHYAATKGDERIIALLLEHYAYIDAESPNGSTPLMMAAMYGTDSAVRQLLAAGADPTLKNALGLTAADFARIAKKDALAAELDKRIRQQRGPAKW